ncbi:MAG: S8 family serine peptidase [Thiotrichales bacterium]|nr:S8 family serine peptidase [Thiotrichales bacterium]
MGYSEKPIFGFATLVIGLSSLSGCGGGGGGGSNVIPSEPVPVVEVPTYVSPYSPIGYQQTLVKAPSLWDQVITGAGITVAVLDSGVTAAHNEFKDLDGNSRVRLDIARSYISDGMGNVYVDTDVTDTPLASYHGTSVASIALGQTTGIAPEANLLPIKISDDGYTHLDAVQQGVRYASQYSDLINVSYSGMVNFSNVNSGSQPSEYTLARSLFNEHHNFALIVSAGNDGLPNGTDPFLDSTLSNLSIATEAKNRVLNVISVDSSGVRSWFSNYPGSCADVYAADAGATSKFREIISQHHCLTTSRLRI